jgi:hypothetical protein
MWGVGSRSPAAWSAREIELQALATLAALAQISTPSAAHFLKSHQLLVQKFAADRDRQKDRVSLSSPRHLSAPVPYVAMVSGMHAVRRQIRLNRGRTRRLLLLQRREYRQIVP